MSLTNKQLQLAQTIDRFVKTIEQDGGDDHELLVNGYFWETHPKSKITYLLQ